MRIFFPFLLFILFVSATFPNEECARICFLMHHKRCTDALTHYLKIAKENKEHDFSLLQKAALALLKEGAKKEDDEVQLMCLLASSICKDRSLYFIHEKALASKNPQLQLAALSVLSQMNDEECDRLLFSALASPFLIIRLEALFHLTKRGHIDIFDKIHSLYVKCPPLARPLFAQIVSLIQTKQGDRFLKQQLLDPDIIVRIAALHEVREKKLDQFLPQVQRLARQSDIVQQEAALMTLSVLKDQEAASLFETTKLSPHPEVSLAALVGLVTLGDKQALYSLQHRAKSGDLFAITILGKLKEQNSNELLHSLAQESPDLTIRFNALDSLLHLKDPVVFSLIHPFLFQKQYDLGVHSISSPGHAFQAWKVLTSASQNKKRYPTLEESTHAYKQFLLVQLLEISEEQFIPIAKRILLEEHKELIPLTMQLIENIHTPELITFLEEQSICSPSPFVRGYALLALYRLNPAGEQSKKLLDWVKEQREYTLIRVKEKEVKELSSYNLSYEETSQLFLEALEAIAMQKSFESIETLLHLMIHGHEKNCYALAGLLIKTAE